MIKWFIEKNKKVPLYLQLQDLIKYYISTGVIKNNDQLPGVNDLARDLEINFDTVRKAYKELEKEGLVSMRRGTGSFVQLKDDKLKSMQSRLETAADPLQTVKDVIRRLVQQGTPINEIKDILSKAVDEVTQEMTRQLLIFTECNQLQIIEISKILETRLKMKVKPVLLEDLENEIKQLAENEDNILSVITTGFHVNEVQKILSKTGIDIQMLVTNMSPETRRKLDEFGPRARFGFICRDRDSIPFYTDLLNTELGGTINLITSVFNDTSKVKEIIRMADVLLVTPPVFEQVKRMAPSELAIYNVFDRVDPMSLKMLEDSILRR